VFLFVLGVKVKKPKLLIAGAFLLMFSAYFTLDYFSADKEYKKFKRLNKKYDLYFCMYGKKNMDKFLSTHLIYPKRSAVAKMALTCEKKLKKMELQGYLDHIKGTVGSMKRDLEKEGLVVE